ncbi:tRNA (guanosine(46)-N7)-methyltransferase TrmB [Desulfosporosinus sp.]|uniref:tRNA (guanosine(46)-N7)-methyltransferase TrmB n=1 Tax=Desulfosporosinus sp. TaxID=157907 RepID=UPI0025C5D97A|nr:tRNA (guanosine(46)-N7)-methyltransferase TrmB [Desulfosporosinus sp.]MBC2725070.1 tRNA (guanosine(46)-N7)-methyltransferase TrmB [Desulfosporosinus sp.]
MRLRKKGWAKLELEKEPKVIFSFLDHKGQWKELFGNSDPIHLELGCGRGRFINQLAFTNTNINYIALDVYDELLVHVLRRANENHLNNIRVIPINIKNIGDLFEQDEIEKIYINFCTPWPKKKHHKRRLTHPNFLKLYQTFLKEDAEIWFKTDDDLLFTDSLEYFKEAGFKELYRTYDLHQSDFQGNSITEYEEKFSSQSIKIKFVRVRNSSNRARYHV